MKSLRFASLILIGSFAVTSFAQTDAATAFDKLKALAGTWEGSMTTIPRVDGIEGRATRVTLRVTSMGHVLMHEMTGEGRPDDPITMLYLDGGDLELTHYCDAGNRPRMSGKVSAGGKTVSFESVHVAGPMTHGHMHGAVFRFDGADRHTEEWTYMTPGGQPMRARIELRRAK
ncbi:MAG TPA: hypothetical protein VEU30_13070 [Thermoanaerobaculia bacterium]|nr:hypothetical protein [Thermoanaerobaculia bacterium]